MSIMNDIRAALDSHLATDVTLPPASYENIAYKPTNGQAFLKTTLIPTSRRSAVRGINPQQRYEGIYNILVCTPEKVGSGPALDIADKLLTLYAPVTDISQNGIILSIDYSEVGLGFLDSPFYCIPVRIGYYIYN